MGERIKVIVACFWIALVAAALLGAFDDGRFAPGLRDPTEPGYSCDAADLGAPGCR